MDTVMCVVGSSTLVSRACLGWVFSLKLSTVQTTQFDPVLWNDWPISTGNPAMNLILPPAIIAKTSTVGSNKRTNDQWRVGRIDSRRNRTQERMTSLICMPAIRPNSRRLLVSAEIPSSIAATLFTIIKVALMSS